jgi:hypothetical protein
MENVTELASRRPAPAMGENERRYGYYHPKNTYGEVRVGTWGFVWQADAKGNRHRVPGYTGFHYFDGPDAEDRALDYADDLMRNRGFTPESAYPLGEGLVEAVFHNGYGFEGTAMRESAHEERAAA